jgi:hypothetical protein
VLGQPERDLHGDPLPGVVAAEERHPAGTPPAFPDTQRPEGPALDAAPDLVQFGDLRVLLGQAPQVLLQRRHRVVAGHRGRRREGGQVRLGRLQLLDGESHRLQPAELELVGLQHDEVGPDLPHVKAEWRGDQPGERGTGAGRRDAGDQICHRDLPFPSPVSRD